MAGKRYGYLDMPEGWSDVNDTPARVPCVECGRLVQCVVEDTWIDGERVVTYCGCRDRDDYEEEVS